MAPLTWSDCKQAQARWQCAGDPDREIATGVPNLKPLREDGNPEPHPEYHPDNMRRSALDGPWAWIPGMDWEHDREWLLEVNGT